MENLDVEIEKLDGWNEEGRYAEVLAETNADLDKIDSDNEDEEVASLYVVRGNALFGLGQFQEALTAYAKAIELDTFDVQARCNYGSTLFTLGRYVDALNACDAAILTDDEFAPAYINAAHCLAALKHDEEAVYALKQAFELESTDSELGKVVADMASDLGNFDVALETYLAVAKLPNAPENIHQTIADFFKRFQNDPELDKADWQKGLDTWRSQFTTNPEVLRLSSELLKR